MLSSSSQQYTPIQNYSYKATNYIDIEYEYYSTLITKHAHMLSAEQRAIVIPWVNKLFSPEYNIGQFKTKRNRYLLMLSLCVVSKCFVMPFNQLPTNIETEVLQEIENIPKPVIYEPAWQNDQYWEQLSNENSEFNQSNGGVNEAAQMPMRKCPVHGFIDECPIGDDDAPNVGIVLDQQFRYLLHIARPYAALLSDRNDRRVAACWLQILCSITQNSCTISKGIRNDYLMALTGYLSNQYLIGPFKRFPPNPLPALHELVYTAGTKKTTIDPTTEQINQFLKEQSPIQEGAFAFLAISPGMYE